METRDKIFNFYTTTYRE